MGTPVSSSCWGLRSCMNPHLWGGQPLAAWRQRQRGKARRSPLQGAEIRAGCFSPGRPCGYDEPPLPQGNVPELRGQAAGSLAFLWPTRPLSRDGFPALLAASARRGVTSFPFNCSEPQPPRARKEGSKREHVERLYSAWHGVSPQKIPIWHGSCLSLVLSWLLR